MTTRKEYIEKVKVKLEEISPFDEPLSFIAAQGDAAYDKVKPIISYIEETLDEAAHECLQSLPITLLHADIVKSSPPMQINDKGVGIITITPSTRFVRLRNNALHRDITAFISSEDPLYLLQQNAYTRGGIAKPIAVVSLTTQKQPTAMNGQMEIYSFPKSMCSSEDIHTILLSIKTSKKAEDILSPIEEFVVLNCAAKVASILHSTDIANALLAEYQSKLQIFNM